MRLGMRVRRSEDVRISALSLSAGYSLFCLVHADDYSRSLMGVGSFLIGESPRSKIMAHLNAGTPAGGGMAVNLEQ